VFNQSVSSLYGVRTRAKVVAVVEAAEVGARVVSDDEPTAGGVNKPSHSNAGNRGIAVKVASAPTDRREAGRLAPHIPCLRSKFKSSLAPSSSRMRSLGRAITHLVPLKRRARRLAHTARRLRETGAANLH
jgi:hypothetical protein